jgi:hypothetical protein
VYLCLFYSFPILQFSVDSDKNFVKQFSYLLTVLSLVASVLSLCCVVERESKIVAISGYGPSIQMWWWWL